MFDILLSGVFMGQAFVEAGKYIRKQRKAMVANSELRSWLILLFAWLFLMLAHGLALFAVKDLPEFALSPSTSALFWWMWVSCSLGVLLNARSFSSAFSRSLLLSAIIGTTMLLAVWPIALFIPVVPLTLAVDITLAVSAVAFITIVSLILLTKGKTKGAIGDPNSVNNC